MNGDVGERELRRRLWERGYATLRAPGSGTIDLPSPDVIAYEKNNEFYVFEIKSEADGTTYLSEKEVNELKEWANRVDGVAVIGIKPDMRSFDRWFFQYVSDLNKTDNGYSIRKSDHEDCFHMDKF